MVDMLTLAIHVIFLPINTHLIGIAGLAFGTPVDWLTHLTINSWAVFWCTRGPVTWLSIAGLALGTLVGWFTHLTINSYTWSYFTHIINILGTCRPVTWPTIDWLAFGTSVAWLTHLTINPCAVF